MVSRQDKKEEMLEQEEAQVEALQKDTSLKNEASVQGVPEEGGQEVPKEGGGRPSKSNFLRGQNLA